ncbi:hypothetical protein CEXT_52281 [Caerostris extrusa]|uniref:Uncharacterized protein n=1 Tax=Caerostris extrusa TaxID=172846 RepID=A0AAV4Y3R3_CAEEX|nr:hypothetical protein CEXT_52281 [Caerostris extrusa]
MSEDGEIPIEMQKEKLFLQDSKISISKQLALRKVQLRKSMQRVNSKKILKKDLNPDKEDTTSQNLPSAEENIEVTDDKKEKNESTHTAIHEHDEPVQDLDKTDENESTAKQRWT